MIKNPIKSLVLILSGLPASGKTTYALDWVNEDPEQIQRARINYDELRIKMFGPDWVFNHKQENEMKDAARALLVSYLAEGFSVVIDNTNLNPRVREGWKQLALDNGAEVEMFEIDTPIQECIARDTLRGGKERVGRAVIERMALFNGFIDSIYDDNMLVIFDMDGTLSDTSHRQAYVRGEKKDWNAFFAGCKDDSVKEPIKNLLLDFNILEYKIIIVSGRPIDKCGIATEDWLYQQNIPFNHLFMRNSGDTRSDVIIKQEILDLLPKAKIAYVVDDRDAVVKMWRENGLTCLQVAEGDF